MGRRSGVLAGIAAAAVLTGVTACTEATESAEPTADGLTVRVMQFNIEYGGTVVDFDSVPKAIEAADADVVALQEAYGNTCKVADALQWSYCDPRTQVVSRFPLITPADPSGQEVIVAPEEGRVFGVVNLHLPSSPYGPNVAAKGADADELIANEKGRLRALEPVLDAANRLQDEDVPVVVLGDFNSPSHRDWTTETDGLRDHVFPVEWPVSTAMEDAGFEDAYRTVFPDPVSNPGLTWPAARPKSGSYNPALSGRPADRIDMTFTSPDITVEDAEIVGESASEVTDIGVDPWPTDHRAVVTEMSVPLADPGPYVSASTRLVDQGAHVEVFAHGDSSSSVQIDSGEGDPVPVELEGGVAVINTADVAMGENTLNLVDDDGVQLTSGSLWVREPGVEPSLKVDDASVARGVPIEVSWQNAPGNKWDWLGVYRRGANPHVAWYKNWLYTGATIEGSASIDADASGGPWPLQPGKYDVILLEDDSYAELARASFTVMPGS